MKEGTKKVLWGQEFDVIKTGLAEEQVVRFVNELLNKYKALAEQKDHFVTMGTISERAAIEADKAATDIKESAKKEAEAEAERIIAEANQKARDIAIEASKKAQESTKQEIEDILSVANQKAAIIETEAKQKTQLFLIKRRREIQDQLKEEVKKAYNQLLSGLQVLLGKGQEIETEWKNKTIEMWGSKVFSLDWHEAMPAAAGIPGAVSVPQPDETGADKEPAPDETKETAAPEPVASTDVVQEEMQMTMPAPEVDEIVSKNGGEAVSTEVEAAVDETTPVVEEILKEAEEKKPKKKKESEKKKEAEALEEEKPKVVADTSGVYEGEVELTIVPPVGLALLSEIHNELDKIPEAKVLQTVGSWDKSTSIKVLLEKPMPLAQILTRIPGVEMDQEMTEKGKFKSATTKLNAKEGRDKYIALRTSPDGS